jgi:hypothetical protein
MERLALSRFPRRRFGSTYCGDDAKGYCRKVSDTIGRPNSGEGCREVLNEK